MRRGVLVAAILVAGAGHAEAVQVGHVCETSRPAVVPEVGATGVPTNPTVVLFESFPGIVEIDGGAYHATLRAKPDGQRTLRLPLHDLPPRTEIVVRLNDTIATRFTTGDGPDREPPAAPRYSSAWARADLISLELVAPPDAVMLRLRVVDRASGASEARWLRGTSGSVVEPGPCLGLSLRQGHETCFGAAAVDLAGNVGPEVMQCTTVEARLPPPGYRDSPRNPVPVLCVCILLLAAWVPRLQRFAVAVYFTDTAAAAPLDEVQRAARRLSIRALVAGALAIAGSITLGTPIVACALPAFVLAALRGRRVQQLLARGAHATTDGKGRVFVVRDGRLASWLTVRPRALVREVPAARVVRD